MAIGKKKSDLSLSDWPESPPDRVPAGVLHVSGPGNGTGPGCHSAALSTVPFSCFFGPLFFCSTSSDVNLPAMII